MGVDKVEKFKDFINAQSWRFAKTYAKKAPHEYVVKTNLSEEDQKKFEDFVLFIREQGYQEKYFHKTMTYFNIGEYKYWTMGDPLDETIILNRADKDINKDGRFDLK